MTTALRFWALAALALPALACERVPGPTVSSPGPQVASPAQQPSPSGSPQQAVHAGETLDCPSGDRGTFTADIGEDHPGGPKDPEAAVRTLLEREGISIDGFQLQTVAALRDAAQVVIARDERRLFSAYVELVGDSWYVINAVACAEFLDGSAASWR